MVIVAVLLVLVVIAKYHYDREKRSSNNLQVLSPHSTLSDWIREIIGSGGGSHGYSRLAESIGGEGRAASSASNTAAAEQYYQQQQRRAGNPTGIELQG